MVFTYETFRFATYQEKDSRKSSVSRQIVAWKQMERVAYILYTVYVLYDGMGQKWHDTEIKIN